eukprot:UN13459
MASAAPSEPYGQAPQSKPEESKHTYDEAMNYKSDHDDKIQLLRDQIWRIRHPNVTERECLWPCDLQPKVTELKDIATQRVFEWESDTTWFQAYQVEIHKFTAT